MENTENTSEYHFQDNSDVENSVLTAASKNYAVGNYNECLKLLLDASHTNADAQLYVDIGNCYYKLRDYKEAFNYWNRAIELDSKMSTAYANLGNLYYKNREREKAISLWLVALISKPEDAQTSLNLAIAFNQKMMRYESIKYFERYIKYEEDKKSAEYLKIKQKLQHCYYVANEYLTLGVGLQNENKEKEAAACYFKALANYPNLSKPNLNLGSIFFVDKNLELAIKYWKIASFIEPNHEKVLSNIAISYDLLKQFDYAYCYYYRYMNFIMSNKDEFSKINKRLCKIKPYLNENPKLIEAHLEKAKEHIARSEFDDAIDEFKNYSILNPESQQTYKDLIKKLESYLNPERDIIAGCFEKGDSLVIEGRYSEAKSYFSRILKLSSPQYLEFSKAKAKYSQCEKAERGLD